jgi:hypothetical protein
MPSLKKNLKNAKGYCEELLTILNSKKLKDDVTTLTGQSKPFDFSEFLLIPKFAAAVIEETLKVWLIVSQSHTL